jgi:hypothetical protein
MPDMIRDGTGNGYIAKVDDENRLHVFANTLDFGLYTSLAHGNMYSIIQEVTPAGAGNCFLYIKNTRPGYDLVIGKMTILSASAETIDIKELSGTPVGGGDIIPVNRNLNYPGNTATGVFQSGTNITGLAPLTGTLARFFSVATTPIMYDVYDGVCIPPNVAVGLYATTGSIKVNYSLVWYYYKEAGVI